MRIMFAGDIVGSSGRKAFAETAEKLKREEKLDMIVANAENAAGGRGISAPIGDEIMNSGADVITLGDHAWDQKGVESYLENNPRVVRPANFHPSCPGHGYTTVDVNDVKVTVINFLGRVFMKPMDCPFRKADEILNSVEELGDIILVDFHAEATSEKACMGRYLDGRVSCVVGTHTHVQTSDECVLPGGTAFITDLGMTGVTESIIGRDTGTIIERIITGMPTKFKLAKGNAVTEGVIIDVDVSSGKAAAIKRIREKAVEVRPDIGEEDE